MDFPPGLTVAEKDTGSEKIVSLKFHAQNPIIVTKICKIFKIFPFLKGFLKIIDI